MLSNTVCTEKIQLLLRLLIHSHLLLLLLLLSATPTSTFAAPCTFAASGGAHVVPVDGCEMQEQITLVAPSPPESPTFILFEVSSVSTHSNIFYWTCPEGVEKITLVAVGGGAGGDDSAEGERCFRGGGGGALAYVENLPTVIGEEYTVKVGKSHGTWNPQYSQDHPTRAFLSSFQILHSIFLDCSSSSQIHFTSSLPSSFRILHNLSSFLDSSSSSSS